MRVCAKSNVSNYRGGIAMCEQSLPADVGATKGGTPEDFDDAFDEADPEMESASDEACLAIQRVRDFIGPRMRSYDVEPLMELVNEVGRTARAHDRLLNGIRPVKLFDDESGATKGGGTGEPPATDQPHPKRA